jgi:hypothetical protein
MSKLKLDIESLTEDFFCDTRLFGIIVTAKNYRFCWRINDTLSYNFRMKPELEIHLKKKGRQYFFSVYEHSLPNSYLKHFIYHNQFDGEYLLPEFKHMDFLWLVKGDYSDNECRQLIESVKSINGVQLMTELTYEQIKNKGNLVF